MKAKHRRLTVLACVIGCGAAWHYHTPEPTVISFRIGDTFEEVAKNSTYPVIQRSNLPAEDSMQFGTTWVTEPAVIIRFNDPRHGFTLPPTKFAALHYAHNIAATLATSPALEKLPFDRAVDMLGGLQNQFQAGGWLPYRGHDSAWFDLTPDGRRRLYARMFEPPYWQEITLRVPARYAMTFRLKCAEGCWTREPPYRFLVDVGIGHDSYAGDDDGALP